MQQFKMRKQVTMAEKTRLVLNKSIDLLHKLSNGKLLSDEVKKETAVLLSNYFVTVYPDSDRGLDAEKKLKLEHFLDQAYGIVDQVELGKAPLYEAIMLMNKVVVSLKPDERDEELSSDVASIDQEREKEILYKAEESAQSIEDRTTMDAQDEFENELKNRVEVRAQREREVVKFRPIMARVEKNEMEDVPVEINEQKTLKRIDSAEPRKVETPVSSYAEGDLINDVMKQQKALESSISNLNESLGRIGYELKKK